MPEWFQRRIIPIVGILGLAAWFAMLYFMFWEVL